METKRRRNVKKIKQEQAKIKLDYKKIGILVAGGLGVVLLIVVLCVTLGSGGLNNKKVADSKLKVEETKLTFENGVTNVKATVKNKGKEEYKELSLKMTFLDKEGKEIASFSGYVGNLKKGQKGNINAAITKDITKAKDVKFKVVD